MKNVKILVCCHKEDVKATHAPYFPLHVGRACTTTDLGITGDDCGDNISRKNKSYCELTGIYWAWKNLTDADVIGVCHYRRYFDFHHRCGAWRDTLVVPTSEFATLDLSVPTNLTEHLKQGEAIVPAPNYSLQNPYTDYCYCHFSDDFRVLHEVVNERHPDFSDAFYKTMYCRNSLSHYNMFIMTRADFSAYCEWLFDVLGEVEKRIDITHYNKVQARVFGYMAERLLNVYLCARGFKLIHRPVLLVSDDAPACPGALSRLQVRLRGWLGNKLLNMTRHNL